ncbi:NAD(P)/FAD-dependent oxidoreductase [Halochromatium glycolicum]|uniref:NAD/FAD-binding protein n=1 Tax=Halochromatium glycolicum TaxID=85075 RepID=A0AAJ0U3Q8_9GAMM|nr:FAD-dependent oxidoreductase [Halochromatium glycolicum]MBK1704738.1 NAD/FAD-binding protein [Halochromatium glycolicum]
MRRQIAVIGSGIAGLASAWLIGRSHDVTLIERNDYVGGHTHTIDCDEDGRSVPVDTGFIVYNVANYPLLTRLFEVLGVATREGDMSFSASIGPGAIEYSGDSLNTLFAQRRNLLDPRFLRMAADIVRFNRRCKRMLRCGGFNGLSVGELIKRERMSDGFRDHFLLPMAAAIWSCPTRTMLDFPAESLARFFNNHGLLNLIDRPLWRTVTGGSARYVERLLDEIGRERVKLDAARSLRRTGQGVDITLASGEQMQFDDAVLACHADQALALLEQPNEAERELLGRFRYQPNRTFLHTDTALMPRRRQVWSSWNYLSQVNQDGSQAVSVTYWMNRLQGLETEREYLVSLNPLSPPRAEHIIAEMTYDHPVFVQAAMDAQPRLAALQGRDRVWFCGSYFGYGFHEDALASAVEMAAHLGVETGILTDSLPDQASIPRPQRTGNPATTTPAGSTV